MCLDLDQRTGSSNMGGGVIFKVRMTQNSFGTKWHVFTKVDPSLLTRSLDPTVT